MRRGCGEVAITGNTTVESFLFLFHFFSPALSSFLPDGRRCCALHALRSPLLPLPPRPTGKLPWHIGRGTTPRRHCCPLNALRSPLLSFPSHAHRHASSAYRQWPHLSPPLLPALRSLFCFLSFPRLPASFLSIYARGTTSSDSDTTAARPPRGGRRWCHCDAPTGGFGYDLCTFSGISILSLTYFRRYELSGILYFMRVFSNLTTNILCAK